MNVLKFGGTSVGSVKNINGVISILENYSKIDDVICVVSAVGGITDKLLKLGELAQNKNKNYLTEFESIKHIHLNILLELNPKIDKSVKQELEDKLEALRRQNAKLQMDSTVDQVKATAKKVTV